MSSSNNTEGAQRSESPQNGSATDASKTINVAVSSRALFNLEEENNVFLTQDLETYIALQISRENVIIGHGPAFPFIKALQNVNAKLKEKEEQERFVIYLMSRNDDQVEKRLQKSIDYYGLDITNFRWTDGASIVDDYLKDHNIKLLLTLHHDDVPNAILEGVPAAEMKFRNAEPVKVQSGLRIAFSLGAMFSEDCKSIEEKDLDAFLIKFEKENQNIPEGYLRPFAEAIGLMQKKFDRSTKSSPVRTYLVSSFDAMVGVRASLILLRRWGLEFDGLLHCMAGAVKDEILEDIKPHIFFENDDSKIRGVSSAFVNMSIR